MNDPANSSDEELADSLSNSDDRPVALLADRYARSLYDFALRLTLDTDAAAEVVRATFEHLQTQAAQRPVGTTVRALLFNFALGQGLEIVDNRARPATGRLTTGDRRFTQIDAGVDREAALWAWQAARSLRPRDYAILDFTIRRGLDLSELSGPVTQGRGGIETILNRARGAFVEAYAATALYFRGRDACNDLSELVGGSGAAMRVGIRRQIVSHAEDCETCWATLETLPNASDVFAALQEVDLPDDLPQQLVANSAVIAAAAAAQLSLEDVAATDDAEPVDGHEPAEAQDTVAVEEPDEPMAEPEAGQDEAPEAQPDEGEPSPEGETVEQPASEEELWAPPELEAGLAGVASTDLPEAVWDIEQRLGVEPFTPPYRPTEVYEQYESEYAAEQPYYDGYEPAPLTLRDRLSIWFEPTYDNRFAWSYALLGVATSAAILLGILVAASLAGGGDDSPLVSPEVVREIACETGPMSLESGGTRTFEFDPDTLDGFELEEVVVAMRPAAADAETLVVNVGGATALTANAAPILSPTARSDAYGLQILWRRGSEDAVTDCPLTVNVPPSAAPASETPSADETPAAEETPEPTP